MQGKGFCSSNSQWWYVQICISVLSLQQTEGLKVHIDLLLEKLCGGACRGYWLAALVATRGGAEIMTHLLSCKYELVDRSQPGASWEQGPDPASDDGPTPDRVQSTAGVFWQDRPRGRIPVIWPHCCKDCLQSKLLGCLSVYVPHKQPQFNAADVVEETDSLSSDSPSLGMSLRDRSFAPLNLQFKWKKFFVTRQMKSAH